jgi:CheY-like chemotaxis protein
MTEAPSYLKGKSILVVDDEEDILETIEDILDESTLHMARDYESAAEKISKNRYDLAILDIMGVNGLQLLEESVAKGIPTVMLTAHAVNPDTLMASIRKGAISYLPKESLADLDELLNELLGAYERGEAPWKLLFDKLGDYFDNRFGSDWKKDNAGFWDDFESTFQIGRGIQERLNKDPNIMNKF